jgi:hypothetical protein
VAYVTDLIFVVPSLYPDDQGEQCDKFERLFERYHEWRPMATTDVTPPQGRALAAKVYAIGVNYLRSSFIDAVLAETWAAGTTMWRNNEHDDTYPVVTVLGGISAKSVTAPQGY